MMSLGTVSSTCLPKTHPAGAGDVEEGSRTLYQSSFTSSGSFCSSFSSCFSCPFSFHSHFHPSLTSIPTTLGPPPEFTSSCSSHPPNWPPRPAPSPTILRGWLRPLHPVVGREGSGRALPPKSPSLAAGRGGQLALTNQELPQFKLVTLLVSELVRKLVLVLMTSRMRRRTTLRTTRRTTSVACDRDLITAPLPRP